MHVIAYLGLPEVTIDVTNLGTDVYCLAEMGKLFGYSGSFTVEDFSELLLLEMLPCIVGEEKKVFSFSVL